MTTVIFGDYEWDANKDSINRETRGIGFLEATKIFGHITLETEAKSKKDEKRYKVIGLHRGVEIAVIYT
mgnify:CR=1 FL=1